MRVGRYSEKRDCAQCEIRLLDDCVMIAYFFPKV